MPAYRRLTRDGRFSQDAKGDLVSADSGRPVLDRDNNTIPLQGKGPATIGPDGTVTQDGAPVARVQVVAVDDAHNLTKDGGGLMRYQGTNQGLRQLDDPALSSGFVEGSGVDEFRQMVAMMNAARDVNDNADLIHYQDQMMDQAVNTLGRVA
jgi:flagellar basal-body rod protein FlgF